MKNDKLLELLRLFTSTEPTSRLYDPFDLFSFTYATNGVVAVRARGEFSGKNAYMVPHLDPDGLHTIFRRAVKCNKFQPIPDSKIPMEIETGVCPECNGDKFYSFSAKADNYDEDNNNHELCINCSGTGVLPASRLIHGFNCPREMLPKVQASVNAVYLNHLRQLPGVMVQAKSAWIDKDTIGVVYFKWNYGDAVLMPLAERLKMDEGE